MDVAEFLKAVRGKRIMVIGDLMVDRYIWGRVERISPEAPVPIVEVEREENRLGGAANVALNLKALGGEVLLAGLRGQDEMGRVLEQLAETQGFASHLLAELETRRTTVKSRVISNQQQMLRVDREDTLPPDPSTVFGWMGQVQAAIKDCDAIVLQDYDKGALWPEWISRIIKTAQKRAIPVLVDPKFRHFFDYSGCHLFKPNLRELNRGLGTEVDKTNWKELGKLMAQLRQRMGHRESVITLGDQGMLLLDTEEDLHHIPAHKRQVADVSGAGDTVISVLALGLAGHVDTLTTARIANLAGGLVCEEVGVVPIRVERLL
jgi:rfaE bifunctional protein kinase chain/domain